jgi:hypothetical protein
VAISKKNRFEVFKRDKFACQYCGRAAPDVLLQVDHIEPRSKGGTDDIINLITACSECNAGKGARKLSDESVVAKQRSQLEQLQERREQLEMMVAWQRGLADLESLAMDEAAAMWSELLRDRWALNENGRKDLRDLIGRFGLAQVLEGMRVAVSRYIEFDEHEMPTDKSTDIAWSKVGGICYNRARWKKDPAREFLDKGFWRFEDGYRSQCSLYPERWALRKWWTDVVVPMIRAHGAEERAPQVAARLVILCGSEYHQGNYGSYWNALQSIPDNYDPEQIVGADA